VVAEILLVTMSVVLAATLYHIASGLSAQSLPAHALIAFAPPAMQEGNATLTIAGVSRGSYPSELRFVLQVDDAIGAPTAIPSSGEDTGVSVAGILYRVAWIDLGGEGTVNAGDVLRVSGDGGPLPLGRTFSLFLVWSDGSAAASASWHS